MSGFFVTGTDTGVGKTYVTAGLARAAMRAGKKVFAFKPIETGCPEGESGEDQETLAAAAGNWQQGELRGLYRLRRPAAPLVAAQEEGVEIDLDRIASTLETGRSGIDMTLVEGAGGWRVPITRQHDMAALASRLALPVIVVARAGLGTINHALLTIEAVERDRCKLAGLVLSRRPDDDADFARSNIEQIAARWPGRIVLFEGDERVLDVFHVER